MTDVSREAVMGLVGELEAKADYTDRAFDNSSLGESYRLAAQTFTALLERAERAERDLSAERAHSAELFEALRDAGLTRQTHVAKAEGGRR